jgi:hypothetical protein
MDANVSLDYMWRILRLSYEVVHCTTSPIAIAICISESWIFLNVSVQEAITSTDWREFNSRARENLKFIHEEFVLFCTSTLRSTGNKITYCWCAFRGSECLSIVGCHAACYKLPFMCVHKIANSKHQFRQVRPSVRPSVNPHGTNRPIIDEFSWNFGIWAFF